MLDERLIEHMRHFLNSEVSVLIASNMKIDPMDALRRYLASETYKMTCDNSLDMWEFSPLAIYDMWENEVKTGDPRNSLYLKG